MESENTNSKRRTGFMELFRKYGYYIALAVLVLILALMIVLTSANATKVQTISDEPATETNASVITFSSPVLNATIAKGFSNTELQYNKTLNIWEVHKAIDFAADIGTDVLACYDGKVTNVSTNLLTGTSITIDHGDNLLTVYSSLDKDANVKVGDVIKKGDVIGKASNTATSEVSNEGEVHFEVWKDGNLVDPANYLDISNK